VTHTCAPVKLFNVNNLKGNVMYDSDRCTRTWCTHKGTVRW